MRVLGVGTFFLLIVSAAAGCVDLGRPDFLSAGDAGDPVDLSSLDGRLRLDGPADLPTNLDESPTDGPAVAEASVDGEPDGSGQTTPDAATRVLGERCDSTDQCGSNVCEDGVCCLSTCGSCRACNLPGTEGTCTVVPAGQDPGNDCPIDAVASCGRDGTCDGNGACRRFGPQTECAPGRCAGSIEFAASTCNGQGVCTAGASRACPGGANCTGASCGSACQNDLGCQMGFFCTSGACQVKHAAGAACAANNQCATNYCVDGLCCSTPCQEMCHACNVPGSPGVCTPVPLGQDPRNVCAPEATACGRDGQCDGKGVCHLHAAGTSCAMGICSGGIAHPASVCDGTGVCAAASPVDCGAYACNGTACGTTCTSSNQCNPGRVCSAGSCTLLPGPVLYWKLDESAGTTALDSSGGGFAGTYVGVLGVPGASGLIPPVAFADPASRVFIAANQQAVRLPNMPTTLRPTGDFTLSAWYRATMVDIGNVGATPGSEIISGGDEYILRVSPTGGEFTIFGNVSGLHIKCLFTAATPLDGKWHHLAGVRDSSGLHAYFDGVQTGFTSTNEHVLYTRGSDFFVARHGFGNVNFDFDGNIDEVRVYGRALSVGEVAWLAQGHP